MHHQPDGNNFQQKEYKNEILLYDECKQVSHALKITLVIYGELKRCSTCHAPLTGSVKSTAGRLILLDEEGEFMNIFKCNSGSPGHRAQRIFANMHGQFRFKRDALVEPTQQ